MFSARPCPKVGAAFPNELQCQGGTKAVDLGQVGPQNPIEGGANIEGGRVDLLAFCSCLGQCRNIICTHRKRGNGRLKLAITFGNLGVVKVVEVQRLGQGKDMLIAVIANQGCPDRLDRRMASHIAEPRQNVRIPFPCHDGANDPHAGRTSDIRDDMMQLQVHLHQRLLHVLDMGRCIFDQPLPLAQIGAEGGDLGLRAETAPQQAVGM